MADDGCAGLFLPNMPPLLAKGWGPSHSAQFLPSVPCARRAQWAQLEGRGAFCFLILPDVTGDTLSPQEWLIPKLTARSCQLGSPLLPPAETSQGNTGHGDVQLPCPLPCGSDGQSPVQPGGCISPDPRPQGRELSCSPGCLLLPQLPASFASASIQNPL